MDEKLPGRLTKILSIVIAIALVTVFSKFYVEWLWFDSVNFSEVFTVTIISKIAVTAVVFLLTFGFVWFNLSIFNKHKDKSPDDTVIIEDEDVIVLNPGKDIYKKFLNNTSSKYFNPLVSVLVALFISAPVGSQWMVIRQFFQRVPYGVVDPIFGKDIGFYFFNFSFYQLVYNLMFSILLLTSIIIAMLYFFNQAEDFLWNNWKNFSYSKCHIGILLALLLVAKAWGYHLDTFQFLFSPSGLIYGATYTDVNASILAYKIMSAMSLVFAAVIVINIFAKKLKWILYSAITWMLLSLILGTAYPWVLQKMVVQPNEFNREEPYLENAIAYTQQAYKLDKVDNRQFDIDYKLTAEDIANNSPTINNIRLWDWQPLKDTYKSLQELRLYYIFHDLDVDRYIIDGRYRQVMLSAREMQDMLTNDALPAEAKTWINHRLMYTHGYGVAMSPVNEVQQEGFPVFFIKDIPPQFNTNLKVTRPEIYFGEETNSYVIVNTLQKEFDYPMGEQNVYTTYTGEQGLKINSFARRLILAWELRDYKIIFSHDITNDSQILLKRNVVERINEIAPYLLFDKDPYLVIDAKGELYWILDAYTVTDKFPYSQPFDSKGNNYIRNSVKITCNAYSGELHFYVLDDQDPLIKTYANIFSSVYQPVAEMPEDLQAHIRYPEDLFKIQSDIYRVFHMNDPWVFYNKEDAWVIPNEIIEEEETPMEPYYIITRLPGEEQEEYIIMTPYNPNGRPNMNAWMCARMDHGHYGEIVVYRFPKQETVYGPMQIESRINQNTHISQQLTLWDQKGSNIYRGNMLAIPINNSLLYIEPLYLQAEQSRMPELKKVLVSYGNNIVMEDNLEQALGSLFGQSEGQTAIPGTTSSTGLTAPGDPGANANAAEGDLTSLAAQARQYYEEADQAIRAGDWAGYGAKIEALGEVIRQIDDYARSTN